MEPKFEKYPNAILLDPQKKFIVPDKKSGRMWMIMWNHYTHTLLHCEIFDDKYECPYSIADERYLILNPNIDGHETLLNISFSSPDRNLKVTLLKRPYLSILDFHVNSDVIYYSPTSAFYGFKGAYNDGEVVREIDGTTMEKYPIFIDDNPIIRKFK